MLLKDDFCPHFVHVTYKISNIYNIGKFCASYCGYTKYINK